MSSLDSRAQIERAMDASINANSQACASMLDIRMSTEDEDVMKMFQSLAELCASNVKVMRLLSEALHDAWSIIDFRRDIDSL